MLQIKSGSLDPNEGNQNEDPIIVEPGDPNSPLVPAPGQTDIPDHPPTPEELSAISAGRIAGQALDVIPPDLVVVLSDGGISMDAIKNLAGKWGTNLVQTAQLAASRYIAGKMNQAWTAISGGGGSGKPPFLTFSSPNTADGGSGPGGGGGSGGYENRAFHPSLDNHLDINGKPGEVTLNVGFDVKGYVPLYKEYSATYTSPVHLSCVLPVLPDSQDYTLGRFQDNAIILLFIDGVSKNVSYNLNASTISATNIRNYFNAVLEGLSYYYWFESAYAYSRGKLNTNAGLSYIRNSFTPSDFNDLSILRVTLSALPIPPNMNQFVCWMYQNWTVNSLGDSPVIKCCPFPINADGSVNYGTRMRDITATLTNDNNRALNSVLIKAFDEWYKADLFPSSPTLEHNADFTTFWANLPCTMFSTVAPTITTYQPGVTSADQNIVYATWTDELDGFIPAFATAWMATGTQRWIPNLITTVNSNINGNTNRFSWTGNTTRFAKIWDLPHIALQRPETYRVMPSLTNGSVSMGPINVIHDPSTERIIGINVNSIGEMGYLALQWLYNFQTIDALNPKTGYERYNMRAKGSLSYKGKSNNSMKSSEKPSFVRPKKQRSSTSPSVEKAMDDTFGGEL